jgi:acetylornithine deacetylase/succinyl-diaminopimelate desuccinylase family protein
MEKKMIYDPINVEELSKIASDLVQIKSYSTMDNQEQEAAAYIFRIFEKEGIEASLIEAAPGRPNIQAVIRGTGGGRSLMLCGHTDTVPAYDMEQAFSGKISEGILYGRGACDMKGALAAMICAMLSIKRSGILLKGDLHFAGIIDEEEQGKGVAYLIKNGPYTDGAIIGEPTNLRLATGNKGLEWIDIEVLGKKVHAGEMKRGINAISKAAKLIDKIENEYYPVLDSRAHPLLGHPTLNFGTINGGDQASTVPGSCTIRIDRRWLPEESIESVYGELVHIIDELKAEDPEFDATVRDVFEKDDILTHRPFFTENTDGLVIAIQGTMETMNGHGSTFIKEPVAFPAWTDAGYLSNYTQISCVILGPGDLGLAHSVDEHIKITDLYEAVSLYEAIALSYCN